jgi:tetratricopeptide (TPR) repeat protein/predicted AlkP superfamily pyrophosphatase or phosphodiesterase
MKRLLFVVLALIVVSIVVSAALLKKVPAGHEAVRVDWSGDISVYRSGYHFILPGTKDFILYPTGLVQYRFPKYGTAEVLTENGEPAHVAFEFGLEVTVGASRKLYEHFSEDFDGAMRRLVQTAAEIEAAAVPAIVDRQAYLEAVADNVAGELSGLGVVVKSYSMSAGGDEEVDQARAEAGVPQEPPRKLIIVGVDGGDWLNLQPLIESGRLPNFARLLRDGATGPLRSMEPMLSPLLWTTMATGRYPEDHGILNFTVADPETGKKVPITRHYRKVDAFWNMAGDYGRKVAIVGWLATHPAEIVNGVMVTDKVGYLAYAPEDRDEAMHGAVYPKSWRETISKLVVRGSQVPYEDCERIIHIDRSEFEKHNSIDFDPRDSINNLILLYASTRTFENIGIHLWEETHPDLLAVYFEWVDAVSHLFVLQSPPRLPEISDVEYRRFKDAVEQAYVVQDGVVGEFIERMDDDTILMVVSDHGFKTGASRLKNRPEIWAGNAAKWHRMNGIIALYGRGIKRGYKIKDATILDIAPTILALTGLPRAADMPGKILTTAFEPLLEAELNTRMVATLERADREESPDDSDPEAASAATAEAMKKLEALGYLAPDNADALNNLGQRYQQRGEFLQAIEEYKKAIAMRPSFYAAYNNLAVCYGKLGRLEEAERAFLKVIEIKPDDFYAMNNLAVTYIQAKRMDEARTMAEQAVRTEPGYVNGHITLGSIYAMTGEFDRAEREFKTALELDPDAADAAENLSKLERHRRAVQSTPGEDSE